MECLCADGSDIETELFGERLDIIAKYKIIVLEPSLQPTGADFCPAIFAF